MGEYFDQWAGGEPSADAAGGDVAPAGAGGDPYAGDDAYPASESSDTASLGTLPGGDDQFTPFSPNGGFNFKDVLAHAAPGGGLVPAFLNFGNNSGNTNTGPSGGGGPSASSAGGLVRFVRQNTGLRVTAHAIVGLIVRYGFQAAATLTKLSAQQLLYLFMREKGVRHHKRGPGLYTVARKMRKYQALQRQVARVLGRGGHHHRRKYRAMPSQFRRKRRRR